MLGADTEALLELEQRRCDAISNGDANGLKATMSEDYVHVHGTAAIEGRMQFVAGVLAHPRATKRGPITIRIYGDTAILIGDQMNRSDRGEMAGVMQQVALKQDGVWRFVSAQMTRKP